MKLNLEKGLISGYQLLELPKSKKVFGFEANGKSYLGKTSQLFLKEYDTLFGKERGCARITPNVVMGGDIHREICLEITKFIADLKVKNQAPDHLIENPGRLLCNVNVSCDNLNFPSMNGNLIRDKLGLMPELSPQLASFALEVVDRLIPRAKMLPMRINKGSVSGYPFFVKGDDKVGLVYYGFEYLPEAVLAYNEKNYDFLFKKHLLGVYTGNVRRTNANVKVDLKDPLNPTLQSVSKKEVLSYESMIRQGNGEDFCELQALDSDTGSLASPFRFKRNARLIMANNISVNCYAQVADALTQSAVKSFDFAYVSSPIDFETKMSGYKHYVAFDYSTFDATNCKGLVKVLYDNFLNQFLVDDYCNMLKMLRASPFLCFRVGDRPLASVGSLFNNTLNTSLMSGWYLVAGEGKFTAFINSAYLVSQFTGDSVDKVLNNLNPAYKCFSMSDDFISCWKSKRDASSFSKFLSRQLAEKKVFYHLKEEIPPKYLGPFYVDGQYNLGVVRLCESLLLPERGFDFKEFPATGWREKINLFKEANSRNPYSEEVLKMLHKLFLEKSREDILDSLSLFAGYEQGDLVLNEIEKEIVDEPTKITWKFIEGLDESFVDHFYTTIPAGKVLSYIKDYCKKDISYD